MSGAEEDRKRAARAEQVALFRYQLIREAADPALSTRQRGRLARELAARVHPGPFGDEVVVSRASIDRGSGRGAPAGSRRWPRRPGRSCRAPMRRCWSWPPG
jgi:hypothetical protein